MDIDEVRAAAVKTLQEEYPRAKRQILLLEVFRRAKSRKAVYQLRDFLDDFASIFREDATAETAAARLAECQAHLRRCAIEPLEYLAEKTLVRIERWLRLLKRVPFKKNPAWNKGTWLRWQKAREEIVSRREHKTTPKGYDHMDKACKLALDLYCELQPLQYMIRGVVAVVLAVAGGVGITLLCQWLFGA